MSNLDHLNPKVIPLLDLPPRERAEYMLVKRFVKHDRLEPILDYIAFLRYCPRQTRAMGLIVYGEPGSGKSTLAEAIERAYPPQPAADGRAAMRPVVAIDMSKAREARELYDEILRELGVPDVAAIRPSDRLAMVIKLCRAAGVHLLVADEIQDILQGTARQQKIALNTIKYLMNELSLSVVVLGTAKAPEAMQVDEHLNARFEARALPTWKVGPELTNFLDALESLLPLRERSNLSSVPMQTVLVAASGGVLGKMVRYICHAAAYAVEEGKEQISVPLIKRAIAAPPTWAVKPDAEGLKAAA